MIEHSHMKWRTFGLKKINTVLSLRWKWLTKHGLNWGGIPKEDVKTCWFIEKAVWHRPYFGNQRQQTRRCGGLPTCGFLAAVKSASGVRGLASLIDTAMVTSTNRPTTSSVRTLTSLSIIADKEAQVHYHDGSYPVYTWAAALVLNWLPIL